MSHTVKTNAGGRKGSTNVRRFSDLSSLLACRFSKSRGALPPPQRAFVVVSMGVATINHLAAASCALRVGHLAAGVGSPGEGMFGDHTWQGPKHYDVLEGKKCYLPAETWLFCGFACRSSSTCGRRLRLILFILRPLPRPEFGAVLRVAIKPGMPR